MMRDLADSSADGNNPVYRARHRIAHEAMVALEINRSALARFAKPEAWRVAAEQMTASARPPVVRQARLRRQGQFPIDTAHSVHPLGDTNSMPGGFGRRNR
jgi:hypothetical protein